MAMMKGLRIIDFNHESTLEYQRNSAKICIINEDCDKSLPKIVSV